MLEKNLVVSPPLAEEGQHNSGYRVKRDEGLDPESGNILQVARQFHLSK